MGSTSSKLHTTTTMPPKGAASRSVASRNISSRARKSGVTSSSSRTARKVSGRGGEQSDDDDSENIVVKSSSGNSESKDDEEMEVSATLTAKVPLSEVRGSRTAGKNVPRAPPSSASTQTTQSSDPDASAVMQVAPPQGRGKGKTVGGKRDSPLAELRRNRRTSSHDSQEGDDDADSPEVSSRSRT